ncbi:MAG TPA: exonuclease domain-containing protein, partial [Thermomicrobiaceae bacterium]|nr:exonuclease domain-containing protein [Thermomicrobiaceae bacterium]
MAVTRSTSSNDYEQLGQRALLFLRENGGVVTEEALIAHVFGGSGNVSLWRSLLRRMLQPEPQLALRADGCWALVGRQQADALPKDFVVIDLETTGLRPRRHRAIEVAIIRYRDGNLLDSYSSLINPERPLPDYIAKLTGIVDFQVAAAPIFGRVADQIRAFIGDDLIVGYNVGFDIGFLNAELQRCGKPILINEALDLLPLAMRMLQPARRSGLDAVSRALGIESRERHRAFPDAEVTAMVFGRLMEIARDQGIRTLAGLQRAAGESVPTPKRRGDVGRGRAVLDRRHLENIPHRPGVYLMHDVHDRVIYVGKAKDLHARVSSYYSQPLGYTRKMDGLLESIERIETVETGSELEALLLEAQLIRRYDPQFNTQLRHTESYPFIRIDPASPWPR